jgi:hypothetical protein
MTVRTLKFSPDEEAIEAKKSLSDKQRESDEKLIEELRNFDLKKFDKALDKAINPKGKTDASNVE